MITDKRFDKLKQSVTEFSFMYPIVTDEGLLIADGEHRLQAARELGYSKVPVIKLPLKDGNRRLLRQVLNKLRGEHIRELDLLEYEKIIESGQEDELLQLIELSNAEIKKILSEPTPINENKPFNKSISKINKTLCPNCGFHFNPEQYSIHEYSHEHEPKKSNYDSLKETKITSKKNKLVINYEYDTVNKTQTENTLKISEYFGIGLNEKIKQKIYENFELYYDDSDTIYLTGDSGSGKSTFINIFTEKLSSLNKKVITFRGIKPKLNDVIVDSFDCGLEKTLKTLNMVGLGEANIFLRRYRDLSNGQKYRYVIGKMFSQDADAYIIDEFASNLDRITATILSYNVQRWTRRNKKLLLVATPHLDLLRDLNPNTWIFKELGNKTKVKYYNYLPRDISFIDEIKVIKGTISDYDELEQFHYINKKPAFIKYIYKMTHNNNLIGVITYSAPFYKLSIRNKIFPEFRVCTPEFLNDNIIRMSRLIIHPKYRGIGVAKMLVEKSVVETNYNIVEVIASMAQYNKVFERAGFKYVTIIPFSKASNKLIKFITENNWNLGLLRNIKQCKEFVNGLAPTQKEELGHILISNYEANERIGRRGRSQTRGIMKDVVNEGLAALLREMIPSRRAYLYWTNPKLKTRTDGVDNFAKLQGAEIRE